MSTQQTPPFFPHLPFFIHSAMVTPVSLFILCLFIPFFLLCIQQMFVVCQHSVRHWRDSDQQNRPLCLPDIPRQDHTVLQVPQNAGDTHTGLAKGLRNIWGRSGMWAMTPGWVGVRAVRRKEREQKVPGSEENLWCIKICCPQEKEQGYEETQPSFRSVLHMAHGLCELWKKENWSL